MSSRWFDDAELETVMPCTGAHLAKERDHQKLKNEVQSRSQDAY